MFLWNRSMALQWDFEWEEHKESLMCDERSYTCMADEIRSKRTK
jgi:hypothetical protein